MNALNNALVTLFISIPSHTEVSPLTWAAAAAHPITSRYLSGQLWSWDGGDAITYVTGGLYGTPDHRCYFVVREGDKVTVEEANSITEVLKARGYQVKVR